jgi:hypothetical protein
MKKSVFSLIIILTVLTTDGFSQKKQNRFKVYPDTISVDSVKYELIIIDPGFDTWLQTKPSKEYYSQNYYEQKNRLYVMEWNYRYMAGKDRGKYETYIDYLPGIDYGLELNYKLFYYFKYFEETNNIMLINTSR